MMQANIKQLVKDNQNYRKVINTGKKSQLVVMCLLKDEEIGLETHQETDQFIVVVEGNCEAIVNNEGRALGEHDYLFVPAGAAHNIINTGDGVLKLYTVYSPAEHADGLVQKTKPATEA